MNVKMKILSLNSSLFSKFILVSFASIPFVIINKLMKRTHVEDSLLMGDTFNYPIKRPENYNCSLDTQCSESCDVCCSIPYHRITGFFMKTVALFTLLILFSQRSVEQKSYIMNEFFEPLLSRIERLLDTNHL